MLQVVFVSRIQKRCGCPSRWQALSALEVSRRHIPSSTPNLAVERFFILCWKSCGVSLYLGRAWGELDICLMRDAIALPEIPQDTHPLRDEAIINACLFLVTRGCLLGLDTVVFVIEVFVQVALYVVWLQNLILFSLNSMNILKASSCDPSTRFLYRLCLSRARTRCRTHKRRVLVASAMHLWSSRYLYGRTSASPLRVCDGRQVG
jgi:hypothetical protein